MNLDQLYTLYCQHYLVDTDTRKIRNNTLYFALKGESFNGNTFAEEALKKGARFSIVDEKERVTSSRIILVDDVLSTLQKLASHHRKILNIPIIGLTGSNGKTTTKELINTVLSTQYNTTATAGNLNNHIGVPLTLLSMTPTTEIGIVEMGANHPKEIAFLCTIATPDFGYITNFGKAHLEGFGSLEGVVAAKSELYTYLKECKKIVFVNPDDEKQVRKTTEIKTILFDSSIALLEANPYIKVAFDNKVVTTNLIGAYNYSNISAAITIGTFFKIVTENIKNSLERYSPTNNRSQIITTKNSNTLILDAYNANPTSVKAALDSFSLLHTKNKVVILGDMFELGLESEKEHQFIADYCTELKFKNVLLVGKLFNKTTSKYLKFEVFDDLKKYVIATKITKHQLLIKGSRGMALERITESL